MVGGPPVAKTADIYARPLFLTDCCCSVGYLLCLRFNKRNKLISSVGPVQNHSQQIHGLLKGIIKYAVDSGFQRDHRNPQLFLQRILFLHIFVLGNDKIRIAGQDLLGFRRLCVGTAHAAGFQP